MNMFVSYVVNYNNSHSYFGNDIITDVDGFDIKMFEDKILKNLIEKKEIVSNFSMFRITLINFKQV